MSENHVQFPLEGMPEVNYQVNGHKISNLEGQILTQVDASISDLVNRQALKDIFRRMIWEWAFSCTETGCGNLNAATTEKK